VNSTLDAIDAVPGDGICATAGPTPVCTLRAAVQEANALAGDEQRGGLRRRRPPERRRRPDHHQPFDVRLQHAEQRLVVRRGGGFSHVTFLCDAVRRRALISH
jgi:CSLREA domain-containing protein